MSKALHFTVIIPAHNEADVIERCLASIQPDACKTDADLDIIVVANGCSDLTAERTRAFAPEAQVIEIAEGSKTRAINEGLKAARHCPAIVLDADIECGFSTLSALASALSMPEVMTAAPAIKLDLTGATRWIRAYYRAWLGQPYAKQGQGGAGCYGMSCEAIQKIGTFPEIISDDLWIHARFPASQRRYLTQDETGEPVFTIVRPPRTLREQISVEARRRIGVQEMRARYPSPFPESETESGGIKAGLTTGTAIADLLIFAGVKLAARILAKWRIARGRGTFWARDLSSRRND